MSDLVDRAKQLLGQADRLERRARKRTRRKTFAKVRDLKTHDEEWLAVEQLAPHWNVEEQTIRKWVRTGALPAVRFGRALRIKRVDALAFEQAGQLKAAG